MAKKPANVPAIVLSLLGIIILGFLISFVYMSLNGKDYSSIYTEKINSGEITNPLAIFSLVKESDDSGNYPTISVNTSEGEKKIVIKSKNINYTLSDIQKQLVDYTSVILKIYNLHNIPFTTITPKVQVYIDNNSYYIEVSHGDIIINYGVTPSPDIIIRTTTAAVIGGLESGTSAQQSLSSGAISIEMVANKIILFSKGYLSLYNELSP